MSIDSSSDQNNDTLECGKIFNDKSDNSPPQNFMNLQDDSYQDSLLGGGASKSYAGFSAQEDQSRSKNQAGIFRSEFSVSECCDLERKGTGKFSHTQNTNQIVSNTFKVQTKNQIRKKKKKQKQEEEDEDEQYRTVSKQKRKKSVYQKEYNSSKKKILSNLQIPNQKEIHKLRRQDHQKYIQLFSNLHWNRSFLKRQIQLSRNFSTNVRAMKYLPQLTRKIINSQLRREGNKQHKINEAELGKSQEMGNEPEYAHGSENACGSEINNNENLCQGTNRYLLEVEPSGVVSDY